MTRLVLVLLFASSCAAITAAAPGGPSVSVSKRALLVDGATWLEAREYRQQFLRTVQVVQGGRLLVSLSELKSAGRLLTVQLESGLMFEARVDQPIEAFLSGLIRDGVLSADGKVDEQAFRAYAQKIGANLNHSGDWDRMRTLVLVNRHPQRVRFTLVQEQLEGKRVEEVREIGPQETGQLTVLLGDVLCLQGTRSCVQISRGLKSLQVSLDGTRFE